MAQRPVRAGGSRGGAGLQGHNTGCQGRAQPPAIGHCASHHLCVFCRAPLAGGHGQPARASKRRHAPRLAPREAWLNLAAHSLANGRAARSHFPQSSSSVVSFVPPHQSSRKPQAGSSSLKQCHSHCPEVRIPDFAGEGGAPGVGRFFDVNYGQARASVTAAVTNPRPWRRANYRNRPHHETHPGALRLPPHAAAVVARPGRGVAAIFQCELGGD